MNETNNCPQSDNVFTAGPSGKSRGVLEGGVAALLAIFIGSLGIQYFYLGKNTAGIIAIIVSLVTCGLFGIIWLIQGILMFTMSQADFERKYVYSTSSFPLF